MSVHEKSTFRAIRHFAWQQTDLALTEAIFNVPTDDTDSIVRNIAEYKGVAIDPASTLLFFDEIQLNEKALNSLRFFSGSKWKVIATGSLLGVTAKKRSLPFPSGVVQKQLHPMNFEEFLWALSERAIADAIRAHYQSGEPYLLHERALDLHHRFLTVGGMPRVVDEYRTSRSFDLVAEQQREIDETYVADTGIMFHKFGIAAETFLDPNVRGLLSSDFRGALAENCVMQALRANGLKTFYWMPDSSNTKGELDFVVQNRRAEVVPIEVKSARNVGAKSLRQFVRKARSALRGVLRGGGIEERDKGRSRRSLPVQSHTIQSQYVPITRIRNNLIITRAIA